MFKFSIKFKFVSSKVFAVNLIKYFHIILASLNSNYLPSILAVTTPQVILSALRLAFRLSLVYSITSFFLVVQSRYLARIYSINRGQHGRTPSPWESYQIYDSIALILRLMNCNRRINSNILRLLFADGFAVKA